MSHRFTMQKLTTSYVTYFGMMPVPTTIAKVTRNGQVSLPAALRRRWGAESVLVIDRGDHAIVRPVPADLIAAVRGVRAGPGPASEEIRAQEREIDDARDDQRDAL